VDVAASEDGRREGVNLAPVTVVERKGVDSLPIVFQRTTLDGLLEIKREISMDLSQNLVTIAMAIKPRWTPKTGHRWTPENRP